MATPHAAAYTVAQLARHLLYMRGQASTPVHDIDTMVAVARAEHGESLPSDLRPTVRWLDTLHKLDANLVAVLEATAASRFAFVLGSTLAAPKEVLLLTLPRRDPNATPLDPSQLHAAAAPCVRRLVTEPPPHWSSTPPPCKLWLLVHAARDALTRAPATGYTVPAAWSLDTLRARRVPLHTLDMTDDEPLADTAAMIWCLVQPAVSAIHVRT